jgi:hypothetical protein
MRRKVASAAISASARLCPKGGMPYGRGLPGVVAGNPPSMITLTRLALDASVTVR